MTNNVLLGLFLLFLAFSGCQPTAEKISAYASDRLQAKRDTVGIQVVQASDVPMRPTDWAILGLEGRVKSITFHYCSVLLQPQGNDKACKDKTTFFFNMQGYKTEEWYWEDFPMEGSNQHLREKRVYQYDGDHRLTVIRAYTGDNMLIRSYYIRYDQTGSEIDEIFDKDSVLTTRYVFTYDTAGRKSQMTGFDIRDSAKVSVTDTFKYDNFGNLVEEKSESKNTGGYQFRHAYVYDKDKKIIKKTTNSIFGDDRGHSTTHFTYDGAGHAIQEIERDEDWRPRKIKVTWDTVGNWVLRTENESKAKMLTTECVIEYY